MRATNPMTNNWEDSFNTYFNQDGMNLPTDALKDFIRSVLAAQKKQIRAEIEKESITIPPDLSPELFIEHFQYGYRHAKSDILSLPSLKEDGAITAPPSVTQNTPVRDPLREAVQRKLAQPETESEKSFRILEEAGRIAVSDERSEESSAKSESVPPDSLRSQSGKEQE
jgi:hypothetical protein